MFNPMIFALNLLANNPRVANDPRNKELIDILKSGDSERGMQAAREICNQHGKTPEQAQNEARGFFNI